MTTESQRQISVCRKTKERDINTHTATLLRMCASIFEQCIAVARACVHEYACECLNDFSVHVCDGLCAYVLDSRLLNLTRLTAT